MNAYVMRKNVLERVTRQNGREAVCAFCQQPLEKGDKVISRTTKNYTKIYHEQCFEGLFVDCC